MSNQLPSTTLTWRFIFVDAESQGVVVKVYGVHLHHACYSNNNVQSSFCKINVESKFSQELG